jgi:hypothetical protein
MIAVQDKFMVERGTEISYLVVNVGGPEASHGAVVRVGGEEARAAVRKDLVQVLRDVLRLADRPTVVDEHGHLLVHRVGAAEEVALVAEEVFLLGVAVGEALEVEREARPDGVRALPHAQQRQRFFFPCGHGSAK